MISGKQLTPEEVKKEIPAGLLAALDSDMVVYCHVCDGIRLEKHTCSEWYPGVKKLYEERGVKLQPEPFNMR